MVRPDIIKVRWQRLMTEYQCNDEDYYGYIYITTNLVSGMRYIGQHSSKEFDKYYYGSGKLIKEALSEFGHDNFKCEVIEWCKTYEELNLKEIYWINFYQADSSKDFYNLAYGGSNSKYALRGENHPFYNKKHKKESINKMSKSKQGKNNPMYGKHQSEDAKRRISEAQIGCKNHMYGKHEEAYWFNKSRSEDTKKKISETRIKNNIALGENNPFYGKHHNKETKDMISNIQKGRIYVNNGINTKRVKPEELDSYLLNGWVKGRILRKKIS